MSFSSFTGGSTTSGFDFGQFAGDVTSSATDGQGGFDSGDAANAALDAAASAIPFGAMAKKFLDGLGLQESIDNVMKYGLSSWGASYSPEKMKEEFAKNVYPYYMSQLQSINADNMASVLTDLHATLYLNYLISDKKRVHHSKAKSTKLAYEWACTEYKKLLRQLDDFGKQFKDQGIKITTSRYNGRAEDFNVVELKDMDGVIRSNDVMEDPVKFTKFQVDFSEVKEIEVDENGEPVVKSKSSFGLLALGSGLLYAIKSGAIKI